MGRQVSRKWLLSRQTFSVLHKCRKLLLSNFFLLLILLLCGKKNKLCLSPPIILGSLQSCRAPSFSFCFSAFYTGTEHTPQSNLAQFNELAVAFFNYISCFKFILPLSPFAPPIPSPKYIRDQSSSISWFCSDLLWAVS